MYLFAFTKRNNKSMGCSLPGMYSFRVYTTQTKRKEKFEKTENTMKLSHMVPVYSVGFKFIQNKMQASKSVSSITKTNQLSGSLISRSSLQRPVKTEESVSTGLNLIRAEGTKSSSSRVGAFSPAAEK